MPLRPRLAPYAIAASSALLAACVVCVAPSSARAEPTAQQKETARALMDRGDELFDKGDYERSLEAYAGAHAIMHVPTTGIEVAKVQEKLGRLVEARDSLLEVVRFPRSPNEPAVFTKARADAERKAAELAGRIPTIQVLVKGAPKDAEVRVTLDRVELPAEASHLPLKANPGKHRVSATSAVTDSAASDVDLAEGQNVTVTLELSPRPQTVAQARGPGVPWKTIGIVTTGAGAAVVLVGGAFGLRAKNKQDDAGCPGNVCRDDASAEVLRDANSAATASTVAFVVGGALLAGGVTMWLLAPSADRQTGLAPAPGGAVFATRW
jgi:hypothetical protein